MRTAEEIAREIVGQWPAPAYPYNLYGPVTAAIRQAQAEAITEAEKLVDERATACRTAGVQGGIDPIEATILDEHLSEAAEAIRTLLNKE
jgi:non-ribosomal peptide synthetase component F